MGPLLKKAVWEKEGSSLGTHYPQGSRLANLLKHDTVEAGASKAARSRAGALKPGEPSESESLPSAVDSHATVYGSSTIQMFWHERSECLPPEWRTISPRRARPTARRMRLSLVPQPQ